MWCRVPLVTVALGLLTIFLSVDIDSVTKHLRKAEIDRLDAAGFKVVVGEKNEGCPPLNVAENTLVSFCFDDAGFQLYPSETWSQVLSSEDERQLVSRWVSGYITFGEKEMARLGAVRVATLVARDALNAPLNEPLRPMMPPERADQRKTHPSLIHRPGIVVMLLVFLSCLWAGRRLNR